MSVHVYQTLYSKVVFSDLIETLQYVYEKSEDTLKVTLALGKFRDSTFFKE
jgi:hypothetical protein